VLAMIGNEYQAVHDFYERMYTQGNNYSMDAVFRRDIQVDHKKLFISATIGSASFPKDAPDYETLFQLIDKTLYRGKSKGRNCYIIYVEEKHKNIEIRNMAGHGICSIMQSLTRRVEFVHDIENIFQSVLPLLKDEIGITDLYYTGKNKVMYAVLNKEFAESVPDIERITNDDIYRTNIINGLSEIAPVFMGVLKKHQMENVLITRISMNEETNGYLICAEPYSRRIWQEDECAIMYFLAKLFAIAMKMNGESLPE
jgi:hypothetical protein